MAIVTLHEFCGEEDICEKLVGMTVIKAQCGEEEGTNNPVFLIDLEDELGNKSYLAFSDGQWSYGEKEAEECS